MDNNRIKRYINKMRGRGVNEHSGSRKEDKRNFNTRQYPLNYSEVFGEKKIKPKRLLTIDLISGFITPVFYEMVTDEKIHVCQDIEWDESGIGTMYSYKSELSDGVWIISKDYSQSLETIASTILDIVFSGTSGENDKRLAELRNIIDLSGITVIKKVPVPKELLSATIAHQVRKKLLNT